VRRCAACAATSRSIDHITPLDPEDSTACLSFLLSWLQALVEHRQCDHANTPHAIIDILGGTYCRDCLPTRDIKTALRFVVHPTRHIEQVMGGAPGYWAQVTALVSAAHLLLLTEDPQDFLNDYEDSRWDELFAHYGDLAGCPAD
jgi:hypothetical protein